MFPPDPRTSRHLGAFRDGLRELGYVEGQNIAIEYRWAEGKYDRLPGLAAELVRLKVDIIVAAATGYPGGKASDRNHPIVMTTSLDPDDGPPLMVGCVQHVLPPNVMLSGALQRVRSN